MSFANENEFERAFIQALQEHGWDKDIIEYPSEADLLKNWADILFANNRQTDRLNGEPLTDGEMAQIIEQINSQKTPFNLNAFINGKTIAIVRDNPADPLHFGKEISLKIYDRMEIAAGTSRYQIVRQPKFSVNNALLRRRRGDLMLLINGMPVFHIELKRSGVDVMQAANQIEKYHRNGVFTNLFALVQIFVAANPEEAIYFANQPQADGSFNRSYFFQWADFNNTPIKHYKDIASTLLSIPMAHELIGFYTIADGGDGCLKVMRSYQYYAASKIAAAVSLINVHKQWDTHNQRGGYIWHTTGSGKTMTSFKSAQLIAQSADADKVIFLMDRIELGNQSEKEFRNFADNAGDIQTTESTSTLLTKLKSSNPADMLIVTSIQKMSNIQSEEGVNDADIQEVAKKRMVFIVDECHRSTFGEMMGGIKASFPRALFFGFTGTPIDKENQRKNSTTSDIFGNELHRYSLSDGIRDQNVLGFDVYRVSTYKDDDLRKEIGLEHAKAESDSEVMTDPVKKAIYLKFQDSKQVPMAGYKNELGKYIKGIEDYILGAQYRTENHQNAVLEDIQDRFETLSQGGLFHAMLATSSIAEAIDYYRLFKLRMPHLKVTALFDPNEDNTDGYSVKEDGLLEILGDYNQRYGQHFTIPTWQSFKKDVANRLAHKETYKFLNYQKEPEKCLDLLIVVDQMLTGFDSKFINTLYVDKLMRYENIIQAFSRTNRLYGHEKPFGTIRYYRYPHSMTRNIEAAVKLYSGDKAFGLFVSKLPENIKQINEKFEDIIGLFKVEGIVDFAQLPTEPAAKAKFAKLFRELNLFVEAAKIQGMKWDVDTYETIVRVLDEQVYLTLVQRYKELSGSNGSGGVGEDDVPFDIDPHITVIETGRIDTDYMNQLFDKFLQSKNSEEVSGIVLTELHKSFATLSQEEQKFAKIFMMDVESGSAQLEPGKRFRDYVTEYQVSAQNQEIDDFANRFGLDKKLLYAFLSSSVNEQNLNEYGRFDRLKESADAEKIRAYFDQSSGESLDPFKVKMRFVTLLKEFVVENSRFK